MDEEGGLQALEGAEGPPIQYRVGLDMDEKLNQLWMDYISESKDKFFWLFLNKFVEKWETRVIPSWELLIGSRLSGGRELGPELDKLPEELLPALSKYLFIGKDETEQGRINKEILDQMSRIVKALTIICLNIDNIPLVGSMEFVSHVTQLNTLLLQHLLEMESTFFSSKVHSAVNNQKLRAAIIATIVESCHFLETLYDPFFRWRGYLCGKETQGLQIVECPVSLHPVTIPFLYESFETALVDSFPEIGHELLTVFGAIISGGQHNAVSAISPATTKMILKTVRDSQTSQDIHINAIYCSSKSIRILHETAFEERQIDLSLVVDQYQQILLSLTSKPEVSLATLVEGLSLLTRTLQVKNSAELQELFARRGVISNFMLVVENCRLHVNQKRTLLPVVINRISLVLKDCEYAQNLMDKESLYTRLFDLVNSCGAPDYNTLYSILAMSTHGEDPTTPGGGGEGRKQIKNIQPIKKLLHWLTVTDYENHEQQVWLTECLYHLCVGRLQNKMLCSVHGLIKDLIGTLKVHQRLQKSSAEYLLKLIEHLGQHSLSAGELKLLIRFLITQDEDNEEEEAVQFPYKSHIIHILSSMAKGSGFEQSRQYFDIQNNLDGISVPGILEWAGPVAGFSFHAWVRLDDRADELNTRRQLYSLYTNSGSGLEAFFLPGGILAVGSAYKKEFFVTTCEDLPLNDGQWHSLTVCQASGKRPFGHSQLSIYIDGTLRTQSSLKYPTFIDPIAYCQIGSELMRANLPALNVANIPKTSIKDNIKDALKSSGVFALPAYLKPTSTDPKVQWTMLGMEDVMWGRSIAITGQIGLIYVFQDCLQPSQAKILHALGANSCLQHHPDQESTDVIDMLSKLVFNYSPKVCHNMVCTNLSANQPACFDGHTLAKPFSTKDSKDVINSLGGIQVLFPILETSLYSTRLDSSYISITQEISKSGSAEPEQDWEMVASSSFSDWNLEKNPVSGFLTLIKNMTTNHQVNQEQLIRGGGVAIMGSLLQKVDTSLIDVNVLMASQLFVEILTTTKQSKLLYQFYHSILFDFRIWSRSEFHMQIGHVQYISTLIMSDRKYFRKKFGVQFFFDVVRQHYSNADNKKLSSEDCVTIRGALFGLVKFFLLKDVNAREVSALLNFMYSNRKSPILGEVLDMLILHLESKLVKDQLFLLLFEPYCLDLIYCILLENTDELIRMKIYRIITDFLRTSKISNRYKGRLHLQPVGYHGFLYIRSPKEPPISLQEVSFLTDHMLMFDHVSSYQGILSLCQHLQMAHVDIKLEIVRKLLTLVYSHPQAASHLIKQVGWEGCIARLLVKEIVQPELDTMVSVEDVISLGDEEDNIPEEQSSPTRYINIVTDTAKQYLPTQAGNAVKLVGDSVGSVADEAGKVLAGTSKLVRSNILNASDKVSSTVLRTHNLVTDKVHSAHQKVNNTVYKANTILETVGDLTSSKKRHSNASMDGNPQFLQNYSYGFGDVDIMSNSSEDISRSRETICSSPTRTHESISEDEISFDMDHFGSELESLKLGKPGGEETREEELVELITNIFFSILWRGTLTRHRKDQASYLLQSYGQIIASVNLMALNNKLFISHIVMKRKIIELCLQALLSDIREKNQTLSEHAIMAKNVMEMAFDLVILDEHDNFAKKVSEDLLDGILGILDGFSVFHEGNTDKEWDDLGRMAFSILLECAENTKDLDFCAIATAKLHSLVQSRQDPSPDEVGYLIYRVNKIIENALMKEDTDHYAFLVPIMKALLDKSKVCLQLTKQLPSLSFRLTGCEFFEQFQTYSKEEEWKYFVTRKISVLHDEYCLGVLTNLRDHFNEFWGNSYEEAKVAVHRRNREIGESKLQFMSTYHEPFRQRLKDEKVRFQNLLTQHRSNCIFVEKRWRILKRLFFGPRGAWGKTGHLLADHWMLGHNENMQRMRMKLVPNPSFNLHLEASAQRDNIRRQNTDTDNLMQIQISKEAVVSTPNEDEYDLTEDDLKAIAKEQMNSQEQDAEHEQEKFLTSEECELVTLMSVVRGRFELTNTYIYFFDSRPIKDGEERQDNRWSTSNLREVYLRRFNLRKSALEFFLSDQTNFFLNFPTLKKRSKVYLKILSLKLPNLVYHGTRSPKDLLKVSGLTQKWSNREISNFEYLMHLNTIAGRSYNDLSQYPVFPWILSDYDSTTLDLGSTATFRDLSKPMGVQNPGHVTEIRQKYENFEDPSGTIAKFHYGTHYSNSAMVLHYMVRMEPFTSLHINLQSGRFDVADRQFHSLPQTWRSLINNINDVKELIPEFFFFPDFLLNLNYFDLGRLQGKNQAVGDVILPAWAANVDDFIRQHRNALESEYVSAHLHEWIDLIFGYKQKGVEGEEAMNIFYYCCYEGAVNLDAISDPAEREALEGMIQNFGQVPCQLLKEPHPTRISYTEHRQRLLKSDHHRPDLLKYSSNWRMNMVELGDERNPLIFLNHPQQQTRSYLYGAVDYLLSVSTDLCIGLHTWLPYDKSKMNANYFYLDKDTTLGTKMGRKLTGPVSRSLRVKPELFGVTSDSRFLVYGGSWDNSVRVYSLARSKEVGASIRHTDLVTCIGMDEGGNHCISGSQDTTAIIWELNPTQDTCTPRSIQVLYGHDESVSCVCISICLDLVVTGSKDGTVNVHSIKDGQYMRTFNPAGVDVQYTVDLLHLSYQGHVIYTGHTSETHSVHVYTLNGRHLASADLQHRVTGLVSSGDYILTGDENGDLNLLDLFNLQVLKSLNLQLPVQTLTLTRGNTHILAPLRDGKLIVVGLAGLPENYA